MRCLWLPVGGEIVVPAASPVVVSGVVENRGEPIRPRSGYADLARVIPGLCGFLQALENLGQAFRVVVAATGLVDGLGISVSAVGGRERALFLSRLP